MKRKTTRHGRQLDIVDLIKSSKRSERTKFYIKHPKKDDKKKKIVIMMMKKF